MALKTPEQFEESVKQLKPRVFMNGKKVDNIFDNPNTRTVIESNKASYAWATTWEMDRDLGTNYHGDQLNILMFLIA